MYFYFICLGRRRGKKWVYNLATITPEVYDKVSQTKVIPIVAEIGEKSDSYIPTYIRTRICIDMSSIEAFPYTRLCEHRDNCEMFQAELVAEAGVPMRQI